MCVVCVLRAKESITIREAKKALFELVQDENQDEQHLQEVYSQLEEEEKKQ